MDHSQAGRGPRTRHRGLVAEAIGLTAGESRSGTKILEAADEACAEASWTLMPGDVLEMNQLYAKLEAQEEAAEHGRKERRRTLEAIGALVAKAPLIPPAATEDREEAAERTEHAETMH